MGHPARKQETLKKPSWVVTRDTPYYMVVDHFLPEEAWSLVHNYFEAECYQRVDAQGFTGHWYLEDGAAVRGPTVGVGAKWHAEYPTGVGIDLFIKAFLEAFPHFEKLLGTQDKDWNVMTAFASLYPRGTGLRWHRDHPDYTGSYTYYAHRDWNIEWGGELLLTEHDFQSIPDDYGVYIKKPVPVMQASGACPVSLHGHLDNRDANAFLMDPGTGSFVFPKPNRLVLIKAGTPHCVTRVKDNAGDHMRMSISGFFRNIVNLESK